jgi:hypothetical protein
MPECRVNANFPHFRGVTCQRKNVICRPFRIKRSVGGNYFLCNQLMIEGRDWQLCSEPLSGRCWPQNDSHKNSFYGIPHVVTEIYVLLSKASQVRAESPDGSIVVVMLFVNGNHCQSSPPTQPNLVQHLIRSLKEFAII